MLEEARDRKRFVESKTNEEDNEKEDKIRRRNSR